MRHVSPARAAQIPAEQNHQLSLTFYVTIRA
jgi:hypothetical protein